MFGVPLHGFGSHPAVGSVPDLLRLLVVPVFAWAAYRDVRTRRLPNRLWPPLVVGGAVLLAADLLARWPLAGFDDRLFLLRVGLSLLLVAPLGYVFWRLGGFGGADAKALIALAVVYPTYPTYFLPVEWLPALPAVRATLGVFSLTVLTNTVLVGMVYPVALAVRNALAGRLSPLMFLARVEPVDALPERHGRLFETREGFTRNGLDLDALRMYLRWRGTTLAAVRADPERFRDPASVGETDDPTDGAVHAGPRTDGGADDGADGAGGFEWLGGGESREGDGMADEARPPTPSDGVGGVPVDGDSDGDGRASGDVDGDVAGDGGDEDGDGRGDPWAAERFLAAVEGSAYGTTPESLREGLETVVERDRVWVSPGLPFVVPMFVGLVLAVTYGDLLFGLMRALGLV